MLGNFEKKFVLMIYTEEYNEYMRLLNIIKSSSKASTLLYELYDMIKFSWYFFIY